MCARMTRLRAVLLFGLVASVWAGCQCATGPCDGVKCPVNAVCNPQTGGCERGGTGGSAASGGGAATSGGGTASGGSGGSGGTGGGSGTGGSSASLCSPPCTPNAPVCDVANNACLVCTPQEGCAAPKPFCVQNVPGGQCAQCRLNSDCPANQVCNATSFTCVDVSATGGGSGGTGGSTGSGGGNGTVVFDDAGMTAHCLSLPGTPMNCTTECSRGYVCQSGQCVLRGSTGKVQVTLRFAKSEDLDLYLVEPLPDGGSCEIFYGQPGNSPPPPFPLPFPLPNTNCGALGYLDLDSNRACTVDNVNTENIIYPPNVTPTSGPYKVRANFWQNCTPSATVPYEVEVRANGSSRYFCGTFQSNQANGGSAGAGVPVTTFVIP
jgi:hypothetical protein